MQWRYYFYLSSVRIFVSPWLLIWLANYKRASRSGARPVFLKFHSQNGFEVRRWYSYRCISRWAAKFSLSRAESISHKWASLSTRRWNSYPHTAIFLMENVSRTPWCRTRALNINIYIYIYLFGFCHALIKWVSKVWVQSRSGLNFFPKNSWTATPLFLPYNNPPLISLWLDLSCDHFSVELPISLTTSWSRKISYQVHLNQSETEKYFERI